MSMLENLVWTIHMPFLTDISIFGTSTARCGKRHDAIFYFMYVLYAWNVFFQAAQIRYGTLIA